MQNRLEYVWSVIDELTPVNAREEESLKQFHQKLPVLTLPFDREAQHTHVTAGALVVSSRGVLLHKHKKLGIWIQTGGHIDRGEFPYESALRETQEETGLIGSHPSSQPLLLHIDVHEAGDHTHLDMRYLIETAADDPHPPPDESQDIRWFTFEEAVKTDDEPLQGLLAAYELKESHSS